MSKRLTTRDEKLYGSEATDARGAAIKTAPTVALTKESRVQVNDGPTALHSFEFYNPNTAGSVAWFLLLYDIPAAAAGTMGSPELRPKLRYMLPLEENCSKTFDTPISFASGLGLIVSGDADAGSDPLPGDTPVYLNELVYS